MKVLILGAKGMIGHVVTQYLTESTDWHVSGWGRAECDVLKDNWQEKVTQEKPDVIINCIGILKQVSNTNPILAVQVNSLFPHTLRMVCDEHNIRLIHISTDCWKDLDTYGRSKRAGEIDTDKHLTVRSVICGPELKNGEGFFHWFMNIEEKAYGFTHHYADGVTNLQMAKSLHQIIEKQPQLSGIKELRQQEKTTKDAILRIMVDVFGRPITIEPKQTETVDKGSSPDIIVEANYTQQMEELKQWMMDHPSFYTHYMGKIGKK